MCGGGRNRLHNGTGRAAVRLGSELSGNRSVLLLRLLHHAPHGTSAAVRADDGHEHLHCRAEPDCAGHADDATMYLVYPFIF